MQLENALIVGDPDSPDIGLKLCDFGYSKDELVGATFAFIVLQGVVMILGSAAQWVLEHAQCGGMSDGHRCLWSRIHN